MNPENNLLIDNEYSTVDNEDTGDRRQGEVSCWKRYTWCEKVLIIFGIIVIIVLIAALAVVVQKEQGSYDNVQDPVLCQRMYGYCQKPTDQCLGMSIYDESLTMKYCGLDVGMFTRNTACCAPSGKVFSVDMENSLSYAFNNTFIYDSTGSRPDRVLRNITDESREAFIKFLGIILKYLKTPEHIQKHTYLFLKTVYDKTKNRKFTARQLQQKLIDIQSTGNQGFLSDWQHSVSCHNIKKSKCYSTPWLYSCGLWKIFHTLTVSADDNKNPLEIFKAIRGFMVYFFDCMNCRNHFKAMYNQTIAVNPSKVNTKEKAILWLFCTHNAVNQVWTNTKGRYWPQHLQFPLHSECPQCWADEDNKEYCTDCKYTNCAELFCPVGKSDCWTTAHDPPPKIVYYNFSIPATLSYLKSTYGGPYSYLNTNNKWMPFLYQVDDRCPNNRSTT